MLTQQNSAAWEFFPTPRIYQIWSPASLFTPSFTHSNNPRSSPSILQGSSLSFLLLNILNVFFSWLPIDRKHRGTLIEKLSRPPDSNPSCLPSSSRLQHHRSVWSGTSRQQASSLRFLCSWADYCRFTASLCCKLQARLIDFHINIVSVQFMM